LLFILSCKQRNDLAWIVSLFFEVKIDNMFAKKVPQYIVYP